MKFVLMQFEEPLILHVCGLDTSFGIAISDMRSNSPLSGNLAVSSPTWETCVTPWWLLSRWIMWLLPALFDWTGITQIMHYPVPLSERNLLLFLAEQWKKDLIEAFKVTSPCQSQLLQSAWSNCQTRLNTIKLNLTDNSFDCVELVLIGHQTLRKE